MCSLVYVQVEAAGRWEGQYPGVPLRACKRASEQVGDVCESKGTVQYLRACACLSGWSAARHQSVYSIM